MIKSNSLLLYQLKCRIRTVCCILFSFDLLLWSSCSTNVPVGWLWNKFGKNLVSFPWSFWSASSKLSSPFQKTFLLTSLSRNHVLACKIPNGLFGSVRQKHKQLYPCVCKVLGPCIRGPSSRDIITNLLASSCYDIPKWSALWLKGQIQAKEFSNWG